MDRSFIILLLEDENGVSDEVYTILSNLCFDHNWMDIIRLVDAVDGRYYLPENHTLNPSVAAKLI